MTKATAAKDDKSINELTRATTAVDLSRPSPSWTRPKFNVHKSLLNFAIPLSQFVSVGINQDHTIHVTAIIVNQVSPRFLLFLLSLLFLDSLKPEAGADSVKVWQKN